MMVSLSLGSRTIVKTRARLRLPPAHPPTSEATSSPFPIPTSSPPMPTDNVADELPTLQKTV